VLRADLKPNKAAADEAPGEAANEEGAEEDAVPNELAKDDTATDELAKEEAPTEDTDKTLLSGESEPLALLLDELVDLTPTPSNIVTSSSQPLSSDALNKDKPAAKTNVIRPTERLPDGVTSKFEEDPIFKKTQFK